MRYINNRNLKLPEGWTEKADSAKLAVESGKKTINDLSAVWGKLKDPLADLSNDKCWYCQIEQERSDNAVDHFRPKNRVANTNPVHEGYWWLAFDPTNYRFSCTLCNSRRKNPETDVTEGKGDSFPLIDEALRANEPGKEKDESPVLLDPCISQDPGLLDFLVNGKPCARYQDHPIKKLRAEESIHFYHLDHPTLIEKRRVLAVKIESWIKKADRLYARCDIGDPVSDQTFDEIVYNLHDSMSEKAELSAFAKRVIAGFRNLMWVEQLIYTA